MEQGWFLVYMVALFALFYFVAIRPQMKAQKAHKELVSSLKVSNKVVTAGGLHGTLTFVGEETVMMEISEGVNIEVTKTAIIKKAD
ncbi:preprotein translocase subunit YajC [Heliorestis convoluta]|uniref:Preprotein translocase subunit YajC n=1 Tax=Heliorestis convoluta TaxID=356322 RepID=A0A5Q2N2B1_9FIRM|nr:preprotein translocase subunit YajC [Heliorestis convoluta]QGG46695.1 preprotein translocase subunit YajC [Heliorestis convoluta]